MFKSWKSYDYEPPTRNMYEYPAPDGGVTEEYEPTRVADTMWRIFGTDYTQSQHMSTDFSSVSQSAQQLKDEGLDDIIEEDTNYNYITANLTEEEFVKIAKMAHDHDVTFNEMVSNLIVAAVNDRDLLGY